MLKGIGFDFDGVLLDTYEKHYQMYYKKYEGMTRELHKKLFEGNIHETKSKIKIKEDIDPEKYFLENYQELEITGDVIEMLKRLSSKFKLFIISSNWETTLNSFLKKYKITNLFSEVLGRETESKKDIKFKMLFDKYRLKPGEIIFITDTLGDVLESKKVGVKSIAIDFGFHERTRLEKGKPWKIASSFKEVEKLIKEL